MMKIAIIALLLFFTFCNASSWPPPLNNSYSGYLTLNETYNANMFYWFFTSQDNNQAAPIILWLEGGPGIPGVYSVFAGPGPYRLMDDFSPNSETELLLNNETWNLHYHMIFVDNPIGVGFSYTDNPAGYSSTLEDVAENLYIFLELFFAKYPQYNENPLFVFGESYGGKYVPALGYRLLQAKQANESDFNLQGVGIGDPLIDPFIQIQTWTTTGETMGLLSEDEKTYWDQEVAVSLKAITQQNWNLSAYFMLTISGLAQAKGVSMYDIREYEMGNAELSTYLSYSFVNTTQWRQYLNVYPHYMPAAGSNDSFASAFYLDIGQSSIEYLTPILENYRMVIYNGMYDWLITPAGTRNVLEALNWTSINDWMNAPTENLLIPPVNPNYYIPKVTAGYTRSYGNLQFTTINDAGHFCTFDQPTALLELVTQFVSNWSSIDF